MQVVAHQPMGVGLVSGHVKALIGQGGAVPRDCLSAPPGTRPLVLNLVLNGARPLVLNCPAACPGPARLPACPAVDGPPARSERVRTLYRPACPAADRPACPADSNGGFNELLAGRSAGRRRAAGPGGPLGGGARSPCRGTASRGGGRTRRGAKWAPSREAWPCAGSCRGASESPRCGVEGAHPEICVWRQTELHFTVIARRAQLEQHRARDDVLQQGNKSLQQPGKYKRVSAYFLQLQHFAFAPFLLVWQPKNPCCDPSHHIFRKASSRQANLCYRAPVLSHTLDQLQYKGERHWTLLKDSSTLQSLRLIRDPRSWTSKRK